MIGTAGNDTLNGGSGDDVLEGLGGNDLLYGGTGANTIDGGSGTDFAFFDFSDRTASVVLVNGAAAGVTYTATVGGVAAGSVTNVEQLSVIGGSGDDRLGGVYPGTGTGGVAVYIDGGPGYDVAVVDLSGYAGDWVSGGLSAAFGGNNWFSNGADNIIHLLNIEALDYTGNAQQGVYGWNGDDILRGSATEDTFFGGGGDDVIYGGGGDDLVYGNTGDNILDGGSGHDIGRAEFGDRAGDVVFVNGAAAGVTYTATVGGAWAGSVKDVELLTIFGGTGDDRIGGDYSTLTPGDSVSLDGGDGYDVAVIDVSGYAGAVSEGLAGRFGGQNWLTFASGVHLYLGYGSEALDFTGNASDLYGGTGDDVLRGMAGNDTFHGVEGDDVIQGGGGSDTLYGGTGNNTIDGGSGADFAFLDFSDRTEDVVLVNGAAAGVTYTATVGGVAAGSVKDVEQLSVIGGSGDDRLGGVYPGTGTGGVEVYIDGGDGYDVAVIDLSGYAGDWVGGGPIFGGWLSNGEDNIIHLLNIEAIDYTGDAEANVYGGTGNDILRGLDGDDHFNGWFGDDILIGNGGDDLLYGFKGNETIDGGAGRDAGRMEFDDRTDDVVFVYGTVAGQTYTATVGGAWAGEVKDVELMTIFGGTGDDRIGGDYSALQPGDQVSLDGGDGYDVAVIDVSGYAGAVSEGLAGRFGGQNWLTFASGAHLYLGYGFEALDFTGNASGLYGGTGDDVLRGLAGNDTFRGVEGNDRIQGGGGADTLYGGADNDVFVYTALSDSTAAAPDLLADFTLGEDRIDLSLIDADTATSGNQAFHLGATAGHVGDLVLAYDAVHNRTVVSLYADADATADAIIWLTGNQSAATVADFVL